MLWHFVYGRPEFFTIILDDDEYTFGLELKIRKRQHDLIKQLLWMIGSQEG